MLLDLTFELPANIFFGRELPANISTQKQWFLDFSQMKQSCGFIFRYHLVLNKSVSHFMNLGLPFNNQDNFLTIKLTYTYNKSSSIKNSKGTSIYLNNQIPNKRKFNVDIEYFEHS
jgi:hypothetical protein